MSKIKRVYDLPEPGDGTRVLIDRLWPRGLTKNKADVHVWLREIAPSSALRTWFNHRPDRWQKFSEKYREELRQKKELIDGLRKMEKKGTVTLLYAAADTDHNHARVLAEVVSRGKKVRSAGRLAP